MIVTTEAERMLAAIERFHLVEQHTLLLHSKAQRPLPYPALFMRSTDMEKLPPETYRTLCQAASIVYHQHRRRYLRELLMWNLN